MLAEMQLDILFLDIDGVLNPDKENYPDVFSPDCVTQLKRLFEARPKTKIVFSTTWRLETAFFVLGWLWRIHDLPVRAVIGRTPEIRHDQRGLEIRQWLENSRAMFPGCSVHRYAVLDDEVEPILEAVPAGNVFACDPCHGLTADVTDRLIQHFSA